MTTAVKGERRKLTLRQQKGRAVNAVAEVLQKKLLVPNIYLEPHSQPLAVDVLAVDRAGDQAGSRHPKETSPGCSRPEALSFKTMDVAECKNDDEEDTWGAHANPSTLPISRDTP
jgi:hypothetical protein